MHWLYYPVINCHSIYSVTFPNTLCWHEASPFIFQFETSLIYRSHFEWVAPETRAPIPQQPVAQPLTKLLMFCKECANCRNQSKCGQKTLLVLRTSDGTNLVKLVKCPKGGGRCSTENQFQAWVSSGLFGNSPIWGPALNCVSGRDC